MNMEYRIKEAPCKSALHHHNSRWLPFKYDINVYRGCAHGCIYCYALYSHEYIEGGNFYREIYAKTNIAQVLSRELPKFSREQVNLGGVTDSYQPAERELKLMPGVLELLARYGVPATLCTKSPLILRDIALLKKVDEAGGLGCAFTVTTMDTTAAKLLEPGAPPPKKRMEAVRELKKQGILCGVHIMPIVPFITSSERSLAAVFSAAKDAGADYVITGALNMKNKNFMSSVRQSFPSQYSVLRDVYSSKQEYKEYRRDLAEIISRVRKRYKMPSDVDVPVKSAEIQMSFF